MIVYAAVLFMTLIGSLGALFFKKSTAKMKSVFSLMTIPIFYAGGILYVLAALLNVALLRVMDYTILYPMTSISYIWSLVIAHRFLGEVITRKKMIGVALICCGVVLLAL